MIPLMFDSRGEKSSILQVNLQIGFTAGLLALAVSLHQCKPQETGIYLSVGRDGACQISSSIHLFERQARGMENEERGKRSSLELRSEFGSGGSANQVYLISGFRMQSRPMEQKRARASEMDEQQYEINPMPVFVNSASNDTVIHVEAKRRQITSLPPAL